MTLSKEDALLRDFLIENDANFWHQRPKMRDIKEKFLKKTRIKVTQKKISAAAKEHCQYFKVIPHRKPWPKFDLDASQWQRITGCIARNRDKLKSLPCIQMQVAMLRFWGCHVNETTLRNSLSYRSIAID